MDEPTSTTETDEESSSVDERVLTDDAAATESPAVPLADDDTLLPLAGASLPELPALRPATETAQGPPATADPEFDAYMAVIRLLVGGTIEGASELSRRLKKWEAELEASEGEPEPGQITSNSDVARYMLVGMALSTGEGVRQQVIRLTQLSDSFWRLTGTAAQPLVNNRFTGVVAGPLDRAFNRLVNSGQKRVNDWVELGRTQEPGARRMARKTYLELVDEIIGQLADNEELTDLIQTKSMNMANEAVDEFRSRTVSADAIAENIVRRILRRPPRRELPLLPEDTLTVIPDGETESH
jgi:hypothetical protein